MSAVRDLAALHKQLRSLQETRRGLTAHLQLTLNALALTLDAEGDTQLRIDTSRGRGPMDDRGRWECAQRQRETEQYRAVLALLAATGEQPADAAADG